jgi:hypothetical protein
MADLHNLGSYNTLEEVWKILPYGGCPGDYVYIAGEQIYWNEYRNVWGNPDAAVSTDPTQTINGDLTVTKDLTVGEHTLGNTAKYNSLEVDNILINSDPFAAKDHNHDLTYSKIGHVHDYAPKSHRHNVGDIDGLGEVQGGGNVDIVTDYDTDIPSNSNIPSMLRLLKELSENNEALAEMFLRKDIPNSAAGLITFLQGLKSGGNIEVGEVIDSFLAGKGIVMTPDGRIQCNTIEARESAKFFELIYNRLSALEGDFVFTESGTIESVVPLDGAYKLIMRKRWDNDITALDVDDVLRSKINSLSAGGEYATGWYRVIEKNTQENSITVVMYSLSECPGGVNSVPTAGMMLHRWGNTNASKADRQRCWYMSSSEGRLVWLTGVNKPIVEQDNYATFYGLPVNLPMFDGKPINYNQPYLYLRGLIVQDIIRVDYQGNTIYELTDRGTWSAVTAASSEPYFFEGYNEVKQRNEISTVYHRGNKWQCLHTNTQLEPKWNSPDWAFLEGNGEFSIDFSSTNGFSFFYGRVNTDVQVEIFHGSVNITEDIKALAGVVVEWKRNSGNEAEDNSWMPTYLDSSKLLLHFTEADMGSSWLQNQSVTFTVTVYIPLGDGKYLPKTESFNF